MEPIVFSRANGQYGSEVERGVNWRAKNNEAYAIKAFERALELMDLTLASTLKFSRLKEIACAREEVANFLWEIKQLL